MAIGAEVASDNSIRVDHRNDLEDEERPKLLGHGAIAEEKVEHTFDAERGGRLAGVDSPCDEDDLFDRLEPMS
jgi:hypothetical protein